MTAITYTPRAGSVAYRVIDFLQRNPGEYLTRGDIAAKFDCSAPSLDMLLADAMRSGLLARSRSEEGDFIWKLGSRRVTLSQVPTPAPMDTPTAAAASVVVDPAAIQIRKGVRLKTPEELLQDQFEKLFATFEVGDSAEFNEDWYPALNVHFKAFRKKNKGVRFIFMPVGPGKMGMERRA